MNKKILTLATFTISAIALGGMFATNVYAASTNEYPPIVDKLASTFNLDREAIIKIFKEQHKENQETRLDKLVSEGKLTQEQRELFEQKQTENHTRLEEIKNSDMTEEEKKAAVENLHEEMKSWLETNDINLPLPMGRRLHKLMN